MNCLFIRKGIVKVENGMRVGKNKEKQRRKRNDREKKYNEHFSLLQIKMRGKGNAHSIIYSVLESFCYV